MNQEFDDNLTEKAGTTMEYIILLGFVVIFTYATLYLI